MMGYFHHVAIQEFEPFSIMAAWYRPIVQIKALDLSEFGFKLPDDRVGMVIAQPFMPHTSLTTTEPYHCIEQAGPQQLAALTKTLEVARAALHDVAKAHFTVFPEYSIPDLQGTALVETALRADDWPTCRLRFSPLLSRDCVSRHRKRGD